MSDGTAVESYLDDGALSAAGWSRALRDGVLIGQRCPNGHVTAAPKAACARCSERDLTVERLPTAGTVVAETTIEVAPVGVEAPYVVALVDLDGACILARTSDDIAIGDEVGFEGIVEHDGSPAPVFEPV